MSKFRVNDQVIVKPESRAVCKIDGVRHHLADSIGEVVHAGENGLVAVEFDLWGAKRRVTLDHRELEY